MQEENVRIIKKYPNRRLYDTAISSYITLQDVKNLILSHARIKVIDARNQNDITHSTLLQIILEQEAQGPSIFTNETLIQMIHFYSSSMHTFLSKILEEGFLILERQRDVMKEQFEEEKENSLMVEMAELAKRNMSLWHDLEKQWMHFFSSSTPQTPTDSEEAPLNVGAKE